MIPVFIAITLLILCFGIIILWFLRVKEKGFGILSGKRIYVDSDRTSGITLYSETINLAGKPDYIMKDGSIPVEVKTTSRIPNEPYQNHVMQLMAYCLLVEENYDKAPVGGYLVYMRPGGKLPEKEFKILYTPEAKEAIISLAQEITELKISGQELYCHHPEHNKN